MSHLSIEKIILLSASETDYSAFRQCKIAKDIAIENLDIQSGNCKQPVGISGALNCLKYRMDNFPASIKCDLDDKILVVAIQSYVEKKKFGRFYYNTLILMYRRRLDKILVFCPNKKTRVKIPNRFRPCDEDGIHINGYMRSIGEKIKQFVDNRQLKSKKYGSNNNYIDDWFKFVNRKNMSRVQQITYIMNGIITNYSNKLI